MAKFNKLFWELLTEFVENNEFPKNMFFKAGLFNG